MADAETLDIITHPERGDAQELLHRLGLDGIPSQEELRTEIEDELLIPRKDLVNNLLDESQIHWDQSLDVRDLFTLESSPPTFKLVYKRVGVEGRVVGVAETRAPRVLTALQSTSMQRAPTAPNSFVRGKSGNVPFWPGGLEESLGLDEESINRTDSSGLQTIPPGFSRGLRLPGEVDDSDLLDELAAADASRDAFDQTLSHPNQPLATSIVGHSEIDDLLPASRIPIVPSIPSKTTLKALTQKRDWAHVVDLSKPMSQVRFKQLVPDMAHNFPFELDAFQKEAVYHLEQGDSVFIAAHTSAGKTVVAEYAIALAAKHMTRAIYTSPIKALSNQKFRDFKTTFSASSVGILTGDVQINPEANCLIMTTEILRSMLYKGADLIRDVEFVIFDEVHYVNDAERGVVWEEVIIMLPDHVNIILLSATVPNTKEFADWVGRTKKKEIYVISTPKRPVPLEHFLYAGRDTFKIVDAKGQFLNQGYKDAGEALRRKQDKEREAAGLPPVQRLGARAAAPQRGQRGAAPRGGRGVVKTGPAGGARTFHSTDKNLYVHLLNHLRKKELLPVVVFTFSKKRCEEQAGTLTNQDLCSSGEKSEVHIAIEKALSRLKGSDRSLPQIARMRDLLSRGIGVHHGGLLPIVKEVVEILFARGLVKILFATETFAMGVNMPARCVVFSSIRKHDGKTFRTLLAGEYTQMSGRAGRRGLDSTGVVIIVVGDELPEMATLNQMMLQKPARLQSQFRLTYNMILNLLRVEALKVEEMIKRSFSENASQRLLPDQQKKIIEIERKLKSLPKLDCSVCSLDIQVFYDLNKELIYRNQQLISKSMGQSAGSKIFTNGRVVILRDSHFPGNVAVILAKAPLASLPHDPGERQAPYFMLAMVDQATKSKEEDLEPAFAPPRWTIDYSDLSVQDRTYDVRVVPGSSILRVANRVLKVNVEMILERQRKSVMEEVVEQLHAVVTEWQATMPPQLFPEVEWSKMRQLEFQESLRSRDALAVRLQGKSCVSCEHFKEHYLQVHQQQQFLSEIEGLKFALSDQNLELLPDYEQRIEVLKDLGFIDQNSTVLLKGRVACEINSVDELILTELILENTFASYELEEIAALLSCFVFQEKTEVEPVLTPRLVQGYEEIMAVAERVGRVQDYHKVDAVDFEKKLKVGLVEVVYEWAKGTSFEEITKLTDVAEGTIVRVITRLDETFREVRDAARVIGDVDLFKKMEEAQAKIKRDIVFAASLYF